MEEEYNLIYTFHLQTIDQKLMYCTHEAHAHSYTYTRVFDSKYKHGGNASDANRIKPKKISKQTNKHKLLIENID